MTYLFLQQYWWFVVSLLGALLVGLMFVQGGNAMALGIARTEDERELLYNSTGRRWEITFTTLVTFGGAFFASFPLFYSTSFGGAYWVWILILITFVLQAVSYEYLNKKGNLLGAKVFRTFLLINGVLGPLLIGTAVGTFFEGSNFIVAKNNLFNSVTPVISSWANASHGLDAVLNLWNVCLGVAVALLAQVLGVLYSIYNIDDENIRSRASVRLVGLSACFLVFFLLFVGRLFVKDGFAYDPATGEISMEPHKYLHNLLSIWQLIPVLLLGITSLLYGIIRTIVSKTWTKGFWWAFAGSVLTVLVILLLAGWNNTAYYPSTADLQSSLTIENSSSSYVTLKTMFWVSLLVPFVAAYIGWAWSKLAKPITKEELKDEHFKY